jgi:tetratricopeptide (TPR) repeat protein
MLARNLFALSFACVAGAAVLNGCGSSAWHGTMIAGEAAWRQNPPQLSQAEANFKTAIELASKDAVPEPDYAKAISGLGEVLFQEGKYADAQEQLLRTVSLATAVQMSTNENVRFFKLLEQAYEKNKNYEQAAETESVLANFVATELSPLAPDYKEAMAKHDQLKLLAQANCSKNHEACCEAKKEIEAADQAAQAQRAVAAQPAVVPGAD